MKSCNQYPFAKPQPKPHTRIGRWIVLGLLTLCGFLPLSAQAAHYQFGLSWSNTDDTVDSDFIERSTDGVNYTQIAQVDADTTSYVDSGLPGGYGYFYRLRSHTPSGYSDYSSIAVGTTPPVVNVTSPADYQVVTNYNCPISGNAQMAIGLKSVTVNGTAATINGSNWTATVALVAGTNTLTIVVTDSSADQNVTTVTQNVVLVPAPVPAFTADVKAGPSPLTVNFTDSTSGTVTGWAWAFGDGGSSTDENPSHTYTAVGSYNVKLTAYGTSAAVALTRTSYISVTNVVIDLTAPTLTVAAPVNNKVYTSSALTLSGAASDTSGIKSVTVNGSAATVSGTSWSISKTLAVGTNVFTVVATDNSVYLNKSTVTVQAIYFPVPVASYAGTPTSGGVPLTVHFTDTSTGSVSSRAWNFGDGTTSTDVNPVHTYTTTGNFTVKFTATGPTGSSSANHKNYISVTNMVGDVTAPTLVISSPADYLAVSSAGLTVSGTASDASGIASVSVNGSTATLSGSNWSYSLSLVSGTNTLTIVATDNSANHNKTTKTVHVVYTPVVVDSTAPTLTISAPGNGQAFLVPNITVNGTVSDATGVQSVTVNGQPATLNGGAWSYNATLFVGTNTLTVVATDSSANHNQTTKTIQVIYAPVTAPTANFAADTTIGLAPLLVSFSDASSGSVTGRLWTFGDGGSSTAINPLHVFASEGTYAVKLTIYGPGGTDSLNRDAYITVTNTVVSAPPVANFSADVTSGVNPLSVHFTDSSSGNVTAWAWTFGDGGSSTDANPAHSFAAAGTYTVSLTVSGPDGTNTMNRANYITVTNSVDDSTAPSLAIATPVNNQVVSNISVTVSGTVSDDTGVQGVTVNGSAATINGTSWSATVTLVAGTNVLNVVATDSSASHNSTSQTVRVVYVQSMQSNGPTHLRILTAPTVTNAMAQVGNVYVITAGQPTGFTVKAKDDANSTLTYNWYYGDGTTGIGAGSGPRHTYNGTNCQGYAAMVVIKNSTDSITGMVQVATACQLDVTKLQMNSNFVKANADRFALSATVNPGENFNPEGQTLGIDVGQAQVTFTLDAAGRGSNEYGKCKLSLNKRTGVWSLTTSLKNGNWHSLWSAYDLVKGPLSTAAVQVSVPTIVVVGADAFAAQPQMQYSASTEKSGSAH